MRKSLFIILSFVIIYSCGESTKQDSSATEITESAKSDTVVYTYTTVAKTEVNSTIKDTANLRKASITYPVIKPGTALADSINNVLVKAVYNNKVNAQQCIDSFLTRGKDENGFGFDRWVYNASAIVLNNTAKLFVLAVNIDSYTGGAHGNYAQVYYNLNKDGKQLLWNDIIEPGKKDSLLTLNDAALRSEQKIPATQSWQDAGFWNDSAHMQLPATFALDKSGLIMTYNHYEVAPYAMGIIRYTIPYNKLKGLIKMITCSN